MCQAVRNAFMCNCKEINLYSIYSEPMVVPSQQAIRNLRPQRKRRRREAINDAAFHHTYVMKLFDRSVDLAQFREDTPLYPICRAWMANQPRNTNLTPKYVQHVHVLV